MSLFDSASLVVTPNGYKATKLYSVIPTDGTGDMTFARAGNTATRVNASGLIEAVNADIPRLDYFGGGCPKLLLEPQRTNLILQSQDISSASWIKTNSPTIVSNVAVAPDGTTTADSIQDTTGSTFKSVGQSFSVSANSTLTFSFFIKKETTKTNFAGFSLYFTGGTIKSVYASIDETNGATQILTGSSLSATLKTESYGNYYRVSMTTTDNGSNTTVIAEFFATISTNGVNFNAGISSPRTIWGLQLEAGSYATSYIPTTTAAVTRNADSCTKASITSLVGQTEGTIFLNFTITNTMSNSETLLNLSDNTSNNYIRIYSSLGRLAFISFTSGSVGIGYNIETSLAVGTYKVAIAYKTNDVSIYFNGTQLNSLSSFSVPAMNKLNLGSLFADIFYANTKINSSALWKTRLSNADLAALTSL